MRPLPRAYLLQIGRYDVLLEDPRVVRRVGVHAAETILREARPAFALGGRVNIERYRTRRSVPALFHFLILLVQP